MARANEEFGTPQTVPDTSSSGVEMLPTHALQSAAQVMIDDSDSTDEDTNVAQQAQQTRGPSGRRPPTNRRRRSRSSPPEGDSQAAQGKAAAPCLHPALVTPTTGAGVRSHSSAGSAGMALGVTGIRSQSSAGHTGTAMGVGRNPMARTLSLPHGGPVPGSTRDGSEASRPKRAAPGARHSSDRPSAGSVVVVSDDSTGATAPKAKSRLVPPFPLRARPRIPCIPW